MPRWVIGCSMAKTRAGCLCPQDKKADGECRRLDSVRWLELTRFTKFSKYSSVFSCFMKGKDGIFCGMGFKKNI